MTSDAQGHVQLEADKSGGAITGAVKRSRPRRSHASGPGSVGMQCRWRARLQQVVLMFGPRDLYRPGETVIQRITGSDSDG